MKVTHKLSNLACESRASGLAENIRLLVKYARNGRDSNLIRDITSPRMVYRFLKGYLVTQLLKPKDLLYSGGWCGVLENSDEVTDVLERLYQLGLPPHPDRPKNWDAFRAFSFILQQGCQDSSILDVGTSAYGCLLSWLHLFGYRNLYGCDLVFPEAFSRGRIQYAPQDLHRTSYAATTFDFITSLSVIEHGVELSEYFSEMQRLLKPGGYLLTSTDYWCDPILTEGIYDELYRCRVRVFSSQDVPRIVEKAENSGFELIEDIKLACEEPVVHWNRMDLRFTFLFFVLRRRLNLA